MMLNEKDIKLLKFKKNDICVRKIKLSTGEYYAKYCGVRDGFRELLGSEVFNLVGIKCPRYYYVKEAYCTLSEDVKKYDEFYNPFELNMNGYTLSEVKSKLNGFVTNEEELYWQFEIMHFIDILFSNIDRHISNYGFSKREDGSGYLVVFDNADFLKDFEKATRPMAIATNDPLDFVFTSKQNEAMEFISHLSDKERLYFLKIYEMFSPSRLFSIVRTIEKENGIKLPDKLNIFKSYINNYVMIGSILKDKGKTKKK